MAPPYTMRYDFGEYNLLKHKEFRKELVAVFKPLSGDIADTIKGDIPDVNGTPVIYLGDTRGNTNHYTSADLDELEQWMFDAVKENDLVIIENVDGGWETWEGRPEWSDTYIDYTEATPANQ
jgi:hypothetical protein